MNKIVAPPDFPAPKVTDKDHWPPDYSSVYGWRQNQLLKIRRDPSLKFGAMKYYSQNKVDFILHWIDTYDPRNAGKEGKLARMPMIMFPRQAQLVSFLEACLRAETDGLVEKCRDMGATWVCCALSIVMWLFVPGASIGWGSRKEQLVDKIGDPDSIFEKLRIILRYMPPDFLPDGFSWKDHATYMRLVNPVTDATITGEAGDNIGRGGRKLIYFKDESAHYDRPEKIEAALGDNTRVQIDISSVHGLGNMFHRRREAGVEWDAGDAEPNRTNVFIMDWRDHPEKTQEWYDARKEKAEREGQLNIFAQEVDRDYSAAVEGTIIPAEWVESAVDSDQKLDLPEPTGQRIAGLDVADGGGDLNSLGIRVGYMVEYSKEWGGADVGLCTRKSIEIIGKRGAEIEYDCIGIGAGVKSEANRLKAEDLLPDNISFVPWGAGDAIQDPKGYVIQNEDGTPDTNSPLNKNFYHNLKAQAWWQLRLRFERTHRAVQEGLEFDPDELICLPSALPELQTLKKQLSQATASRTTASLKLVVEKAPDGARSPNRADALVMAFWPKVMPEGFTWYVSGD